MLGPLKGSAEFAAIGDRLADDVELDSWQEDGLHFFVFQLRTSEVDARARGDPEAAVAVFAMHPESSDPVAAVTVTPRPGGAEANVRDLRAPETAFVIPAES